jgi:hypothetical protein
MRLSHVTCAFLTLGLLAALSTRADASGWGWLDKLSGPGPFDGKFLVNVPIPCTALGQDRWAGCVPKDPFDLKFYATLEIDRWNSQANPLFTPDDVDITAWQVVGFVPLTNIPGARKHAFMYAFDVGAGLGAYRFSGAGVRGSDGQSNGAFSRLVIPLRLTFTPSELFATKYTRRRVRTLLAIASFHVGADIVPGTFDNTDFFGPPGYSVSGSVLKTAAFIIDLTPLLARR